MGQMVSSEIVWNGLIFSVLTIPEAMSHGDKVFVRYGLDRLVSYIFFDMFEVYAHISDEVDKIGDSWIYVPFDRDRFLK